MSDPKATKMTLEEAVEIVAKGRSEYAYEYGCEGMDSKMIDLGFAEWDHARAIVDQAVKAHKARCVYVDNESLSDDFMLGQAEWDNFKKLRALERGESEVQP